MGLRARLFVLVAASVAAAVLGMRAHERARALANAGEESGPAVVEPPVDAPANLGGEVIVASPDASWRKTQVAIGSLLLLAPPTTGGVLAAASHVPELASIVDGDAPLYAVLGDAGQWVIAVHSVSASRARSTLLGGDAGTTSVVEDSPEGHIAVFRGAHAWVGLAGNYVLVADGRASIATLGPYAYRTLPTRALPESTLWASATHAALSGPIKSKVERQRDELAQFLLRKDEEQRAAHDGRAPDLADPKALVTAFDAFTSHFIDAVTAMASAQLTADLDADGIHLRVAFKPSAEGPSHDWASELEGGGTAALGAASDEPIGTLFWRSTSTERERTAKNLGDTITAALGARIPASDEAKLTEAFGRIARARAGWSIASMTGGATAGALLRFATNDAPAISSAIESAIDLTRKPGWSTWERDALGIRRVDSTAGHASFVTEAAAFESSWASRGGEVDLAVGLDANAILASMSSASTLGADARIGTWLRSLRTEVVWALVARPLAVATQPHRDPLLVALVRGPNDVVLDARTTSVLLRQLAVTSWKGFGL